jgi:hypothetical protein
MVLCGGEDDRCGVSGDEGVFGTRGIRSIFAAVLNVLFRLVPRDGPACLALLTPCELRQRSRDRGGAKKLGVKEEEEEEEGE